MDTIVYIYMAACQKYASANNHETSFSYGGVLSCCPTGVLPAAPVPMLGHHCLFTLRAGLGPRSAPKLAEWINAG